LSGFLFLGLVVSQSLRLLKDILNSANARSKDSNIFRFEENSD